jgi:hypothetical protein
MSTSFGEKFMKNVTDLATQVGSEGNPEQPKTYYSQVDVSTATVGPGDILFFSYRSTKYNTVGTHMTMVISSKKSPRGIYIGNKRLNKTNTLSRKYMSAVKLNNILSTTASLIINAYQNKKLKYVKKPQSSPIGPAPWIALVGRDNYRTYVVNSMSQVNKLSKKEHSEEKES